MAKRGRGTPAHPLWELTLARLLEFWRSPGAVFWVFIFPVLLAVALGIAFRDKGTDSIRVAVVGHDPALAEVLAESPHIEVVHITDQEARDLLHRGRLDALVTGDPEPYTLHFDPSRPDSEAIRLRLNDALQRASGRQDIAVVEETHLQGAGGRYIDFLIPGLIGMNMMSSCMWGIGYAVVDQRKRKLLRRFAATPMNRAHYLLGFMFSRMLFLILEVGLLLLFGHYVFGLTVHGSILAVWGFAVLGALTFSGMSVLIAARTENTEVASGWMNFAMLPMWLLSGTFFDYTRFPEVVHPFIRALPLTAVNDALRGLINHGTSITSLGIEIAVLALWGLVSFFLALRFFRWQ
jgi:ABC-2 type transport system permease protein